MGRIETAEHIDASPERVWEVLTALAAYREWNPLVVAASGDVRDGARIKITVRVPGGRERRFRPRVVKAERGKELRWIGKVLGGWLFTGEHFFVLEPDGGATRFVHGEVFSGAMPALLGRRFVDRMRPGYEAMNQALKLRAETGPADG